MICKTCGKEFTPTGRNASRRLTCGEKCSLENRRDANKAWKLSHKERKPKAEKRKAPPVNHNDPKRELSSPDVRFRNRFLLRKVA